MRQLTQRRRSVPREGGFVFTLLAVGLLAIILSAGFATDLGSWYLQASKLQRAADTAALSGAAVLPDAEAAVVEMERSYARNGLVNGVGGITINAESDGLEVRTEVRNDNVPVFFTSMVFSNLTIERSSSAERNGQSPQLGSPFNVLGTGDLQLGSSPRQNFWLAINGACSPKEDGDYFNAMREGNKGPFTTAKDANGNFVSAPNGRHDCNGGTANPDADPAGHSYFIDVPAAPVVGGYVDVMIYDPAFNGGRNEGGGNYWPYPDIRPDAGISLAQDNYMDHGYVWDLLDTHGTLDDASGHESLLTQPSKITVWDPRLDRNEWWQLARIPYDRIENGGQFRVQVYSEHVNDTRDRGINSFSIGAFPSWKGPMAVCDSREDDTCPSVYGQSSMSVNTQLTSSDENNQVEFFFAQMDKNFAGQSFDVMLWDPGEGVSRIELLLPDGTPTEFNWSTDPDGGVGYSGTGATFVQTDETGPRANGASLSNEWKFNGRLLTLSVTLPGNYPSIVDSAGSDWLRMRYTVGTAANDRTTWGVALPGGKSGLPQLTRYTP